MRHSIYLTLATLLIKADLKREERMATYRAPQFS